MAYYYKGARILAPLNITSNEPVFEMTTVSLKTRRASQGAQRFELSFTTEGSAATEAASLVGALTGITDSDTMIMPQLPSIVAANTISTSRAVVATGAVGDSTVSVSANGTLKSGSFIKFSNHSKIYVVTEDVLAGSVETVSIYPTLRTAVGVTDDLLSGDLAVLSYYRNVTNVMGITFTDGILSNQGSISLIEAV